MAENVGKDGSCLKRARALVLASSFVVAGIGPLVSATAASAGGHDPVALGVRGSHGGGGGGSVNLADHGGLVLPAPTVYTIWWGPSSAWSGDVQGGMASFFTGLDNSSYLNTASQYMRGASATVASGSVGIDSSAPPRKVSPSTLGAEALKVFKTVDPNGVYFVFTSNFPSGGGFCAWHGPTTVNGTTISVAYMPNTTGVAGCDPGNLYGVPGSQGLRSLANVTAHEFMESITDPLISAWYDNSGSEIGDKCAWMFSGPVTLSKTSWQLQEEWSNSGSHCVQTTP